MDVLTTLVVLALYKQDKFAVSTLVAAVKRLRARAHALCQKPENKANIRTCSYAGLTRNESTKKQGAAKMS
jgi:hypothetical protein